MIYAEGGTANGTHIMKFKRGSFVGNAAIQPFIQKHSSVLFSAAYDTLTLHAHLVLMLCSPLHTITVYKMPPFIPNEYLYDTHTDKGEDKAEIYAWALREAMSKASGMPKSDMPIRKRLEYEGLFIEKPGGF